MNLTIVSSTAPKILTFISTTLGNEGFLTVLILCIGIPLTIYVANRLSDWVLGITSKEEKKRSHWP